ncbi:MULTISPECIES: hypothetical protein [Saccharothrix]|uniref:hypothetical protein n=1 Tax=Saccharothrix TaxID=2071 RepID=UPI00093D7DB1|nr:hypothetical protein [Saccharothrix sp. CB00851]
MTAWTTLVRKVGTVTTFSGERTTWRAALVKAVVFDLSQHARNRLALALVVFFIPAWIGLVKAVLPDRQVRYHSQVAGRALPVAADELITVSGALNAVTLIVGFMMFSATRRSREFDQRLVLAGYPRSALLLAKLAGLLVMSSLIAAYAAVVMTLHWEPRQVWLVGFSLFVSGLTYGGMGVVLGLVLSTELAGMFVIIMVSLVEVMFQNPVTNPSSDQSVVRFLPTYGAMQTGTAAGFTDQASWGYALLGMVWLAAFGSIATTAFRRHTRDHARRDDTATTTPAVVTVTTRADGSLEVRSTTGPVLLCSHLQHGPAECGTEVEVPPQPRRGSTGRTGTPKPRAKPRTTVLDGVKAAPRDP